MIHTGCNIQGLHKQTNKQTLMKKDCQALEKFKIETDVVGSIFELQSPNFVKMHNF